MKRIETISFKKFMDADLYHAEVMEMKKVKRIKIQKYCMVAGYTIVLLTGFDLVGHAAGLDGIDQGGKMIYGKLLSVGRWIIIVKGGIDTINNMIQGDGGAAKRNFLTYLIVYLVLKGLPWAFDEIDVVFKGMQG